MEGAGVPPASASSMLQKVKKFRDRIFSASLRKESSSGTIGDGYSDGPDSPGVGPNSPRAFAGVRSKNSSYNAERPGELAASNSAKRNMLVASGGSKPTITLKEHPMLQDSHPSPTSHSVVPPVQIGSNNNSFSNKNGGVPPNIAAQLMSPSSGRRKSTPAALDMVLRTAEGKAAVEQLLNGPNGQSKMMFGNYFAGTSAAVRDQAVAQAAAEKQRMKAASAATASAGVPNAPKIPSPSKPPLPPPLPPSLPPVQTHSMDTSMASVPEDVAMEDAPAQQQQQQQAPANIKKHPVDSLSMPEASPPSPSGMQPHKHMAVAPQPQAVQPKLQQPAPVLQPQAVPVVQAAQQQAALVPQMPPPQQQQHDEPSTSNRPATKLVALSPQLPATMQRKYWTLADYNIIRKMYTGYASTVYQALCKKSLEMVALKVYHMENLCELNHYQVFREIRVHSSLQHQHVIHLFAAFQEGTDVVLVQEYAEGGDLYRLLHKNGGRLSERQAVEMVLHPFLLALHYLHMRGIMHRDIKPENVLFTDQRVLKLADFGLAIDLTEERAVTRAGTLDYMAPEVLRCPPKNLPQENKNNPYLHYNNSVDAWAVGVFAYELIVGFPPFAGETQLDSVDKIMHSVPEFPEKISEFAKDFICQCLRKHPGDRPTVMEMLHHPWIRTFQRRTSMRITAAPRRRSSVTYNPAAPVAGSSGMHPAYTPPQEAAEEGEGGEPMDTDVNYNEMTPEQIENMIRKLQVAKQHVLEKTNSPRNIIMQAVQPMQH